MKNEHYWRTLDQEHGLAEDRRAEAKAIIAAHRSKVKLERDAVAPARERPTAENPGSLTPFEYGELYGENNP